MNVLSKNMLDKNMLSNGYVVEPNLCKDNNCDASETLKFDIILDACICIYVLKINATSQVIF